MQVESYYPFLLVLAPFAFAFLAEALVIYLFRLKPLGAALRIGLLINLLSLLVIFGGVVLLKAMGYTIGGLQLPLQVILFFWWLSTSTDGFLLRLFTKDLPAEKSFLCSIVMNSVSWLFLYLFILFK